MLVCHCRAIYDREVRAAIAGGARDPFEVAEECGAGTVCGGCLPAVQRILGDHGCPGDCEVATLLSPDLPLGAAG